MLGVVSFNPVDEVREYVPSVNGTLYESARGEYTCVHTIAVDIAGKRRLFVVIPRGDGEFPILFYLSTSAGTWVPIKAVSTQNGDIVTYASIMCRSFDQFIGARVPRGDTTTMERIYAYFPDFEHLEWSASIDAHKGEPTTSTMACIEAGFFDRRGDFETSKRPSTHIKLPADASTFMQWIRDNGASHLLPTKQLPTVEVDEGGRIRKFTVVARTDGKPPMLFYYSKSADIWASVSAVNISSGECMTCVSDDDSFPQFVGGRVLKGGTVTMQHIYLNFESLEHLEVSASIDAFNNRATLSTRACREANINIQGNFHTPEKPIMRIKLPANAHTFVKWIRDTDVSHVLTDDASW